jgi:hypothetical protein
MDDAWEARERRMRALTHRAHAGQTRNGGRVPYWVHTDGVAEICRHVISLSDEIGEAAGDVVLAAYGHDLFEDTWVTPSSIRREFGDRVARWIGDLTNEQGDHDRAAYLGHLAVADEEVRLVKCADLIDNMLSVAYGIHDLGLPWAQSFFLPIASDTRAVLAQAPFRRLTVSGRNMLDAVEWAWARMCGSVDSALGQPWAEGGAVAESKDRGAGELDEETQRWLDEMTFTDEQWAAAREKRRREEEERRRRLFGDSKPFAIPDTDTDA